MPNFNIRVDAVLPKIKAAGKRQVFEALAAAKTAGKASYPPQLLYMHLSEKEKRSPSAIGDGVAVLHAQLPGIPSRFAALATLEEPVNFDAPDGKPVDLVCMLLSPESDGPVHLRGLSRISRLFKNEELCARLRDTADEETIRALIMNPDGWLLAA